MISTRASSGRSKRCCRRRNSCSASSAEPADVKPGAVYRSERSRAGVAAVVFPLEERSGRRTARHRGARRVEGSGGADQAGQPDDGGCSRDALHERLRRAVAADPEHQRATIPIRRLFPGFDDTLRDAMVQRDRAVLRKPGARGSPHSRSAARQLPFLNEQLAQHYGITDIYGSHFRRVTFTDERRFGLLGQASILTVTSYADRTSVVLRGKWVLENLLGAPPPPPPPNVPPLKENDGKSKPTALRERMEQHAQQSGLRELPLADGSARLRARALRRDRPMARERRRRRDQLDDRAGRRGPSTSPKAFREALLGRGRRVRRARSTEKLLTYALGRGVDYYDAPIVRQLVRDLAQNDYRWSALVLGIVKSTPFQMRTAAGSERRPACNDGEPAEAARSLERRRR